MGKKAKAKRGEAGLDTADLSFDDGIDLSKLDRLQLLQLLDDAVRENERLSKELAETKERLESELADAHRQLADARRQLEDKHIAIEESGTLAEAALRLAGIFTDAQHAIDLYAYNVAERDAYESGAAHAAHHSARSSKHEQASSLGISEIAFDAARDAARDAAPSPSIQYVTGSNPNSD